MKKSLCFVVIFIVCSFVKPVLMAQDNDFGIWYTFSGRYSVNNKLSIALSPCMRMRENASEIYEYYLEPSITYKPFSHITFMTFYRMSRVLQNDEAFHYKHMWMVEARRNMAINEFGFILRARLQEEYQTYLDNPAKDPLSSKVRVRLRTSYNIPNSFISPYIYGEVFIPINESEKFVDKTWCAVGMDFKINDKNSISLSYVYQLNLISEKLFNVVMLNYDFKL